MRALLCGCGRHLEAEDDDRLCGRVLEHIREDHPTGPADEGLVREIVASRAFKIEYAVVYADGGGPDEEFGPEPY